MGNSGGNLAEYWQLVRKYPKFQGGFDWDFADQALRGRDAEGRTIYKYGGDYNDYDPSDNNFNCNGIVGPTGNSIPTPTNWPTSIRISGPNPSTSKRVKSAFATSSSSAT